jgi:hypothetical protein
MLKSKSSKIIHALRSLPINPTAFIASTLLTTPSIALGSVESSLGAIQDKLISTILPLLAIIGIGIASLSFVTGNQNARAHFVMALIGAAIGFGAPSIIAMIRGVVH